MGASLTLPRGLVLPLVVSVALAALLLATLLLVLASAEMAAVVVAHAPTPFRWT